MANVLDFHTVFVFRPCCGAEAKKHKFSCTQISNFDQCVNNFAKMQNFWDGKMFDFHTVTSLRRKSSPFYVVKTQMAAAQDLVKPSQLLRIIMQNYSKTKENSRKIWASQFTIRHKR